MSFEEELMALLHAYHTHHAFSVASPELMQKPERLWVLGVLTVTFQKKASDTNADFTGGRKWTKWHELGISGHEWDK